MHWRGIDLGEVALVHLAELGEPGRPWYLDSAAAIEAYSMRHGFDPGVVCDVLAILSPRVSVQRSVEMADHYLRTGQYLRGTMKQRQAALQRYRETGAIRGPKVQAFSAALRGDTDAVVIDAWMYRALREDKRTARSYRLAVDKVRQVANRLGWPAAECQAAIWQGARTYVGYSDEYRPMYFDGLPGQPSYPLIAD